MSEYEESLSFIKGSDDSLFPDWLFKPSFNDFDDDYYEKSFVDSHLQMKVKKIRRRYNDYFKWEEAMEVYTEYMNSLVDKWGSLKLIMNSVEKGTMPDYVPSKPRLKNTKRNRRYLRSEIVPSRRYVEMPVTDEEMIAIARRSFPDRTGEHANTDDFEVRKMTKEEKLAYERMSRKEDRQTRRANMYRDVGNSRGTDFIVEYLNQAKRGIYDSSGFKKKNALDDDNLGLVARAKEINRRINTPQWILDEELKTETVVHAGRVVNRKELEQTEIYKLLYEQGFDVIGSMSGKLGKKSVKMIRNQIGATEPMTKKELKKLKKRNKKDQARLQRKKDEDEVLSQVLLRNKIKGSRDSKGNLSLRMQDLFPGGY